MSFFQQIMNDKLIILNRLTTGLKYLSQCETRLWEKCNGLLPIYIVHTSLSIINAIAFKHLKKPNSFQSKMYCKNTINLSYSRTSNEISFTQSSKSKDIRDPPKTGFLANRNTIWNRAGLEKRRNRDPMGRRSSEEKGLIFDWSG